MFLLGRMNKTSHETLLKHPQIPSECGVAFTEVALSHNLFGSQLLCLTGIICTACSEYYQTQYLLLPIIYPLQRQTTSQALDEQFKRGITQELHHELQTMFIYPMPTTLDHPHIPPQISHFQPSTTNRHISPGSTLIQHGCSIRFVLHYHPHTGAKQIPPSTKVVDTWDFPSCLQ